MTYSAPLRDMRFVYHELYDGSDLTELPGYEEATPDLVDAILEEAAKFCENELAPLNRIGDEEGCTYENGVVRTPPGFKEAYDAFTGAGWSALSVDPAYGGQGMPKTLDFLVEEMICASNLSFGTYPGLTIGAFNAINAHGEQALKDKYLPNMVAGTWSGTMCLTEPQCGTDLGLVRTKAVPQDDGSVKITGTKIFITAGEHDMTENIIHLVLAKLPDAPPGIKGISLFLVPKFLVNDDGSLGQRNGVMCGSIEEKMGIHGSSTCVMNFEEATGWLVGVPHKGMRAMFTMMNNARMGVACQGIGLGEASYQMASTYAKERLQGRSVKGPKHPDKPADPLIVHPDIRRMLLTMRAYNEGNRALAVWVARALDFVKKHPDPAVRAEHDDLAALLTPIAKAFFTDCGFEVTNLGVQIHGGMGFIRETGVEQFVRDARIAQIYEGANGIQALDLVGRKMPQGMGRALRFFFHPVSEYIEEKSADPALMEFVMPLAKAFGRLQKATGHIAQAGLKDPEEAAAAASDYLRLFGLVGLAYVWTRMAEISMANLDGGEKEFYAAKISTARFYMKRLLPQTSALFATIMAGADSLMELDEAAF